MVKLFYYDDETENLLEEPDAGETSYDEVIEELFNLEDDDISYVGLNVGNNFYKIKSDDYDSYKLYEFHKESSKYELKNFGDLETIKAFVSSMFPLSSEGIHKVDFTKAGIRK